MEESFSEVVFTFDKSNSLMENRLQELVDKQSSKFEFFLIKVFHLQKKLLDDEPEVALELIDISQKILLDGLNTERKYMEYMNSTISHEMRNPLNSIHSQIQVLESL
mmetsp:Transcript_17575/g.27150  ORF Transcript_17575/g.27150 Transcript_17575/m.27150 type:complete len:107 (+) Transcript_17575:663-983(+)|eukprot:CAMPEP_0170511474 /NCGR_PEP_ID=MMETSP0208-20121228/66327_1 /TAXON_ID=197538 /ORGANISM="Strombidium inclinatum, Strain S3" /LENGTH=106 /DNA_ID=CAMNT_0010795023 /DNA_START=1166 /DNA_END=1486 /DNA_ORIENTATION=+